MTVEITGTEDIQRILEEIAPRHARNLARATVHGVAGEITKDAKKRAPVETGNLKKAIKTRRKKSPPDKPTSLVMVEHGNNVRNDAFYWRFVEYGTLGKTAQPERPFIAPAAHMIRSNIEKIYAEQFGKKLEKALARQAKKRLRS